MDTGNAAGQRGAHADERVSRTVIKSHAGFHAELPGLDLATLIQMACARRERLVVRVTSHDAEGYIFSADGRLHHATLGDQVGDEAVLRMLAWTSGEFTVCDRPFPVVPSIEASTESLLLRAVQRIDETAHEAAPAPAAEGERHALLPGAPRAPIATPRVLSRDDDDDDLPTLIPAPRDSAAPALARDSSSPLAAAAASPSKPVHTVRAPRAPSPPPLPRQSVAPASARHAPGAARPSVPPPPPLPPASARHPGSLAEARLSVPPAPPPQSALPAPAALSGAPAQPRPSGPPAQARPSGPPAQARPSGPPAPPRQSAAPGPARPSIPPAPPRQSVVPAPTRVPPAAVPAPPRPSVAPAPLPPSVVPTPPLVARSLPPSPPPPSPSTPPARGELLRDVTLIASVRVDAQGQLVDSFGGNDMLPQLVAYVARVIALLRRDFSLDPFDALHAELSGLRVLVYEDAGDMVGLMMRPGEAVQDLRQRLGV